MEIPNREVATAQAAKLVIANLMTKVNCPSTPAKELKEAILPIFGIRWNIDVIRRIGGRELRHILWYLRNTKSLRREYSKLSQLWQAGLRDQASFPLAWENWRALIERFNLDDENPLEGWFVIVDTFIKLGWTEPFKLAQVCADTFKALTNKHSLNDCAFKLWKAAALVFVDLSAGTCLALKGASGDAESLLIRLKAVSLADSAIKKRM